MKPLIGLTMSTLSPQTLPYTQHATNSTYTRWVEAAGGVPVLLPNIRPDALDAMLAPLNGVLATGGDDVSPLLYGSEPHQACGSIDVPRDRFELPLLARALAGDLPLLGICRGIQSLNVAAGGTLRQDLVTDSEATVQHRQLSRGEPTVHHTVRLDAASRLQRVLGAEAIRTNSYHHQAVDQLGEGFVATAWAIDGVIEAMERPGERFVLAVQWHPEMMPLDDPVSGALFDAFVAACRGERVGQAAPRLAGD